MCKNCVNNVYSLSESRRVEHIFCTPTQAVRLAPGEKSMFSTSASYSESLCFSTPKNVRFTLLNRMFSTQYTGPITNTTKYINK